MENNRTDERIYEFEGFRLDASEHELKRGAARITLTPKAVELLTILIERRGQIVTREEILNNLWRDTYVDESNLTVTISMLRKAFGVKANDKHFIETVPKRGYRFNAEVRTLEELIVERQTRTHIKIQETETADEAKNPLLEHLNRRVGRQSFALLAVVICIVVFGAGLTFYLSRAANQTASALSADANAPRSIAVLPLKNLSKDAADESLSVGLTDALISKLSNVKNLAVRPTRAVLPFASNQETLHTIGEKLQVETVLEGTIQREGERLRVSVQLIRASDNQILWAGNFDEATDNLFKFQDAFAANITDTLAFKLTDDERNRLVRRETDNAEAFQLYLKGRYFWNKRTGKDFQKAIEFFEQARTKDPNYALAYVGLADSYKLLTEYNGMPAPEAYAKAREAATKAIELDPNSGEAHTSLAYTLAFYDWRWQEAENEFKRAIELNPNYATTRQWYSEYLVVVGRFDEAMSEIEQARQLDPTSLIIASDVAGHFYMARQFDRSIEQAKKVVERDDKFVYACAFLWIAQEQKGEIKAAAETIFKCAALYTPPELVAEMKTGYERGGWQELWRVQYKQSIALPMLAAFSDYHRAIFALRIGDRDKTFDWLEKSLTARNRWIVNLKYDPQWDAIRGDSRFGEIVRRINLEP